MNYFIFVAIFLIVLFLYLHIVFHLKKSNDLEIYDIEKPSKEKLEEICDLRQPFTFKYEDSSLLTDLELMNVIDNYDVFDVNIRNIKESSDDKKEMYIPLRMNEAIQLFRNDNDKTYITMNNQDFLQETGLIKKLSSNDQFLRPSMVSKCMYDLYTGSIGSSTPLMYNVNYRNFYLVTHGNVSVTLIPPVYSKYLYGANDYLNFEFRSPINPWDVQEEYKTDFQKIKKIEVTLQEGDIIHIPSYWWYSIKYNKLSSISVFNYRTYMNTLSILPYILIHLLQKTNVKHKIVKEKANVVKNDVKESDNQTKLNE